MREGPAIGRHVEGPDPVAVEHGPKKVGMEVSVWQDGPPGAPEVEVGLVGESPTEQDLEASEEVAIASPHLGDQDTPSIGREKEQGDLTRESQDEVDHVAHAIESLELAHGARCRVAHGLETPARVERARLDLGEDDLSTVGMLEATITHDGAPGEIGIELTGGEAMSTSVVAGVGDELEVALRGIDELQVVRHDGEGARDRARIQLTGGLAIPGADDGEELTVGVELGRGGRGGRLNIIAIEAGLVIETRGSEILVDSERARGQVVQRHALE
jgi:hypothetical protein